MRHRSVLSGQPPDSAEMIPMVIEAHASGRSIFSKNRDLQFEFQRIFRLDGSHQRRCTTEKGIARQFEAKRQAELICDPLGLLDPALAKLLNLLGRPDADIFAPPE